VFFKITRDKGPELFCSSTQVLKPNGVWKWWNSAEPGEWTLGEVPYNWGRASQEAIRSKFPQILRLWWVHECGYIQLVVTAAYTFEQD
jgi:hypothetical protein